MSAQIAPEEREERVWKALSDPSRRRILDLLRESPLTTGGLTERFEMSRFGVMKHLAVLVEAGLVLVERRGRERWNRLNALPIQEMYRRWIRPFESAPADGLLRLRDSIEQPIPPTSNPMKNFETPTFGVADAVVEVAINTSPERVWEALTKDIALWWPRAFNAGGDPIDFVLDAKLGGLMAEHWEGGGGFVWGQVVGLKQNEQLILSGEVSPDFGGPVRTMTRIRLESKDGGTLLRLSDTSYGKANEKSAEHLESGWVELMQGCLKPWAEEKRQPDEPVRAK